MTNGGFLEQKSARPGSLAIVIALHATAVTALLLSKTEFVTNQIPSFKVKHIDAPPPPPKEKQEVKQQPQQQQQKSVIEQVAPEIRIERPTFAEPSPDLKAIVLPPSIPTGTVEEPAPIRIPEPDPQPKADPVRSEARMLASSELQPPYPTSEERAQNEGSVTVRIVIGTDGRVKSVEKVRGASEAFYKATEQQALRYWRFKPATEDGRPVESRKTMTVHFRLMA